MHESDTHPLLAALGQSKGDDMSAADQRMVERCRDMAFGSVLGSFKAMLDKLADDLFEAAENAVYRDVQNQYMDAMTVARDKRDIIETGFRKGLLQNSERALKGLPLRGASVKQGRDELSLVEPDELEESLATQDMAARIRSACTQEIGSLEQRMGALLHDPSFSCRHNPLAPEVFADAFMEACKDTQADIKVRLIFVMMWDRHMQRGMLTMYSEVNAYLIEKGVLPKLTPNAIKRSASGAHASALAEGDQAAEAASAVMADGDLFATLQQLFQMAGTRGGGAMQMGIGLPMMGGAAGAVSGVAGVPGVADAASIVGTPGVVLMTQLTALQHGQGEAQQGEMGANVAMVPVGSVGVLRELKAGVLSESTNPMESMTIDIVAMMFDFIFEDKQVPDALKALIGRLQIPVLKAALLDQSFFSKKQHPTRKLLNALADAAVGWGDEIDHESALYKQVEAIVERVLNEFEDDLEIFVSALADFDGFLEEREREAEQLAQASAALLAKREEEQQARHNARAAAEAAVRGRAEAPSLSPAVRDFLCQRWTEVLVRAHLLGGEEGSEWIVATNLMDDLIWSIEPKMTESERKRLVQRLPSLLRGVREGMDKAGIVPQVVESFMGELIQLHAAAVKAGFHPTESQPEPEVALDTTPLAELGAEILPPSAVILPFIQPEAKDRSLMLEVIQQPDQGSLVTEEITIAGTGWVDDEELGSAELASDDDTGDEPNPLLWKTGLDAVDDLKPGVWVEFRHQAGETLQAKLKWISPMKSAYLFTDRQGKRAVTMPADKLEAAFKIGSARILDESPLVDRAVDNMLESLKKAAA